MNQNRDNFSRLKKPKHIAKKGSKFTKTYLGTRPNCSKWFCRPCLDSKRYILLSMQSKTSYLSAQTRNPIFRIYIYLPISCSVHLATNTNPEFYETLRNTYLLWCFFQLLTQNWGEKTLLTNKKGFFPITQNWEILVKNEIRDSYWLLDVLSPILDIVREYG